jgi:hypothetical protein
MTKTDELISKLEEAITQYNANSNTTSKAFIKILNAWNELKEQIKKEENINDFTIPYLKSEYNQQLERITKIIGKKPDIFEQGINALLYIIENKVNPDVMPDTCCGKYNEEVIGFDVIERHNKKCFDDTLSNIKETMNGKKIKFKFGDIIINHHASKDNPQRQGIFVNYDKNTIVLTDMKGNFWFPLLDNDAILEIKGSVLKEEQSLKSAEEIKQQFCNELESILLDVRLRNYKTDDGDSFPLVDHLSEIGDNTISSGKEEISNIIEQIYFRLDELSIFTSQPIKDITDEEILNAEMDTFHEYVQKGHTYIGGLFSEGAKWMRDKMKSL